MGAGGGRGEDGLHDVRLRQDGRPHLARGRVLHPALRRPPRGQ